LAVRLEVPASGEGEAMDVDGHAVTVRLAMS
jgi:hypothetical protein